MNVFFAPFRAAFVCLVLNSMVAFSRGADALPPVKAQRTSEPLLLAADPAIHGKNSTPALTPPLGPTSVNPTTSTASQPVLPAPGEPGNPDGSALLPAPGAVPPVSGASAGKPVDKNFAPIPSREDAAQQAAVIESEISPQRLGLIDAVRITLLKDPTIKLSAEDAAQAKAALRIATGQFDFRITGNINWSYQQRELPADQVKQTRNDFKKQQLQRSALTKSIATTKSDIALLKAGKDPLPDTSNITDAKQKADADQQNLINAQIQDLTNQILQNTATPAQLAQLEMIKAEGRDLSAKVETDLLKGLIKQKKSVVQQIKKFPPISVRRSEATTYELELVKEFRNGISLGPYVDYSRTNDNFTRRSGIGDFNQSTVGLQVSVPLGRGIGDAASAQERSSAVDFEASRLALQHTASQSVLNTILSYWNVVAAQQRLRLLLRSELISGAMRDLSRELIKADELASSEISQIEARRAITTAQRISAEQDLVNATQALAVAMGLSLDEMVSAPIAGETFPEPLSANALKSATREACAATALQNRSDRLAALKLQESGKILVEAARINLRPRFDVQVKAGYSSNVQDSQYEDYWRAYDRAHGPSFSVGVSLDWPLENNVQKGILEQTSSAYEQNVIQTDQLSRIIISNVVVDLSSLQRSRKQIQEAQISSDGFEKALQTEREKLKLGNSTLIDTIDTEQNLTNSLLQVVSARLQYASALVQLRFDTGTLLPRDRQASFTRGDLVSLPPTTSTILPAKPLKVKK